MTCTHNVIEPFYSRGVWWKLWRCPLCSIGCAGYRVPDGGESESVECCNCHRYSSEPGT
jgi:hypothetical protein